jgi:membrane-associated phospholipid phosphatase
VRRPVRMEQRPLVLAAVLLGVVAVSVSGAFLVHRLVVVSWPPLAEADRVVLVGLHDVVAGWPWLVFVLKVLGRLGTPLVYQALMAVVAAWLLWRRRPVTALYTVVTIMLGLELPRLVKGMVRRPRPELLDPVADAGGYSFPSGHAVCATVVALTFLVVAWPVLRNGWRRTAVVAVVVVVVVTCVARLGLGVHYLTDVVAGVLLGVGWVALTTAVLVVPLCREVEQGQPHRGAGAPGPRERRRLSLPRH